MADVQIKNSLTNTIAAKRSRYEKMEVAFGKITSDMWDDGDILVFDQIPMKELIHARFVSDDGNNPELELFHSADLSSAQYFNLAGSISSPSNISYVISYIKGTGKVQDSAAQAGEGKLLKVQVYFDN